MEQQQPTKTTEENTQSSKDDRPCYLWVRDKLGHPAHVEGKVK